MNIDNYYINSIANNMLSNSSNMFNLRPLMWKGQTIPGYMIHKNGVLYNNRGVSYSSTQINGRNYSLVNIEGHQYKYRLDYMVAYTFLGMYPDAIRLIHINNDISDDRLENLQWYRISDIINTYKTMGIINADGSVTEEWRPCYTEYNPDLGYEISNFGMVRDKNHKFVQLKESHGYRVFYYLDPNKTTRIKQLHRAVAEAFIPNPNGYDLVNHLDGNKFNDIVYNLEWANTSMNMEHAYLQDLNLNQSYTENQVHKVCKLLEEGKISHVNIAKMTGVDRKTISDIYKGRRWQRISRQYSFTAKKWTPEMKMTICKMILDGKKVKDICDNLNLPYEQSTISFYERMRRELRAEGKL